MAISSMAKILIACHKSQASQLLESLQQSGICQVLNAEEAMVSKHYPDLGTAGERPRHIEEKLSLVSKSIAFLHQYADTPKGLAAALAPRVVIDKNRYDGVIEDKMADELVEAALNVESKIERFRGEIENIQGTLARLQPWAALDIRIEELAELEKTLCLAGLLPANKLGDVNKRLAEAGAAIEQVGSGRTQVAILVVCLKDNVGEAQKILRAADFESVSFEGMSGTVAELISQNEKNLAQGQDHLKRQQARAKELARDFVKLQILHDHYLNLLNREQTASDCPATERTVILEGWVRKRDFRRLEQIICGFEAAQVAQIQLAEGEEVPVEIDNRQLVRPFEVITRLYGMPQRTEVDPTVFLMPFFTLFFGICLGDAGYGLMTILLMAFAVWKMQGDKKILWMLMVCGVGTMVVGALTGSWFGNTIQQFIPALDPLRKKLMWFDPLEKPLLIFGLSLGLGYIQIMFGLLIAFFHNLRQNNFVAAVCDQLTWLVMLNSVVIFGLSKAGVVPAPLGRVCATILPVPAITIVLFSCRQGSWGGRLGMGAYNLFSSIFYLGDVLSYLRLMGLMLVGAGLGMAINVICTITFKIPYGVGIAVTIVVFAAGHTFNLVLSALGAFVHTLRLQFVEFFPKFLAGGGRLFEPFSKEYTYIYLDEKSSRP